MKKLYNVKDQLKQAFLALFFKLTFDFIIYYFRFTLREITKKNVTKTGFIKIQINFVRYVFVLFSFLILYSLTVTFLFLGSLPVLL